MYRLAAALILVALASAPARADRVSGFGEYGWGTYSVHGDLADEMGGSWLHGQLAGGLMVGDLRLSLALDMFDVTPRDPAHSSSLFALALGGDVRYYVGPAAGTRVYGRAGYRKVWMDGQGPVTRRCDVTGLCDGGFWTEAPNYNGTIARLGGGLEYMIVAAARKRTLVAFFVDVGYDRWSLDVIERQRTADVTSLMLGVTFGGGRLLHTR